MRPLHRVLLALGVVCAGGASGFFAAHLAHRHDTYAAGAPAGASGLAPAGQAHEQPPASDEPGSESRPPQPRPVPANLPDITLPDPQGVSHSLAQWKGHPLVVNFWATWCAPCRREIPLLKLLRHERAADGVEVVGIAVDFRDAVQRYAHEMRIDYPVLVGEQDGLNAIAAFGMETVFPFTIFADRQGRILTLKVGELHPDEARFILDRVRDVDQGVLGLAAARHEIADGIARMAAQRAIAGSDAATPDSTEPTETPPAPQVPRSTPPAATRTATAPLPR